MLSYLPFFVVLPFVGFLVSLLMPARQEGWLSKVAFGTAGLHLLAALVLVGGWLFSGCSTLNQKDISLYSTPDYEFFIDLYFDKITATYLVVGSFLTFLIVSYSRTYMHREPGYKRFFNTILFFYAGYTLTIFAGNLETLFIGWEVLGISSFLLIAFYRDRYLPVKNAVKVFSVYRIGDVGLILAMWMMHHLWHQNITFEQMNNHELVHEHLMNHSVTGAFIALMLLLAAAAKSAQLPFSSWLPRAMEGPTPSSAIFYGSLSVHLGVFLLLRTDDFWEQQTSVRILIGLLGLVTAVLTTGIARVQSSVKSQIAYASIAQIGLMFIEIAFGWEDLALFHFAGNAFLRTYQLLVSPSVVSYLIRDQFYTFDPRQRSIESSFPRRIAYSFYLLCLKEWNLDILLYRLLWSPGKWVGSRLNFLTLNRVIGIFGGAYLLGLYGLFHKEQLPDWLELNLSEIAAVTGLVLVLKAFTERKRTRMAWVLVILNHFWVALAIMFNETFKPEQTLFYLSGIVVAGALGFGVLTWMKSRVASIEMDQFRGHSWTHPVPAFIFLVACLGVSGFPITPTFIGEDLIFTHIREDQWLLAGSVALCFILDGLAIIRIYARVFLGPHAESVYEMAYRSS